MRILGTPPLPYLSGFPETNVRLYAVDPVSGLRGVVFRSLEAARLLPVLAARASYRLPYLWARMAVRHGTTEGTVAYETSRRWPGPRGAGGRVRVRIGEPVPADELSLFLTARWGLFSTWYGGRTAFAPVDHPAWPLHRAELLDLSDDLVAAAGLPVAGGRAARAVVAGRAGAHRPAPPALSDCRRQAWPAAGRAEHAHDLGLLLPPPAHLGAVRRRCSPLLGRVLGVVGRRVERRNPHGRRRADHRPPTTPVGRPGGAGGAAEATRADLLGQRRQAVRGPDHVDDRPDDRGSVEVLGREDGRHALRAQRPRRRPRG